MPVESSPYPINSGIKVEVVDPSNQEAVERFSGAHEETDDTISEETLNHLRRINHENLRATIDQIDSEGSDVTNWTPPSIDHYPLKGLIGEIH